MRIDANRYRNVVNLVVGKQPVTVHLPGVQHLAAQGQNGLAFLVAAHLGTAPSRVALHQKHFVVRDVLALAICQLAGQHRHAGAFAFLNLLAGFLARLGGADGQLGQFFAVFHMLVQPQLQRRAHEARHQPHCVARIQPLFYLALKLGVEHLGAEHVTGAGKHVVGQQLDAFGQQTVQFDKTLDRREQAVAQAAFVRAARAGGNQVDITFAHWLAIFGKGNAPGRALAFGKIVVRRVGKALAVKQGNHQVAAQGLHQVVGQAPFVQPAL